MTKKKVSKAKGDQLDGGKIPIVDPKIIQGIKTGKYNDKKAKKSKPKKGG